VDQSFSDVATSNVEVGDDYAALVVKYMIVLMSAVLAEDGSDNNHTAAERCA